MALTVARILVPTDFSETADAALRYAKVLAGQFGASIDLLHVFSNLDNVAVYTPEVYAPLPPEIQERALRDARECLLTRLTPAEEKRFGGTRAIVTGLTAPQIVKYADGHGVDLIVMGTHGRRGVAHLLLGSVAEHVVRTAACPVLTVRDSGTKVSGHVEPATSSEKVA